MHIVPLFSLSCRWTPTFQRNELPASSRSKRIGLYVARIKAYSMRRVTWVNNANDGVGLSTRGRSGREKPYISV